MKMVAEMAVVTFDRNKKVVIVQWGKDWDSYDTQTKKKMIEVIANTDACLNGEARDIEFYRRVTLVGTANHGGINLK